MKKEYNAIYESENSRRYFWRQLFVCLTTTTYYFMIGLTLGSPTVALPQLKKEANLTSDVSIETASWINSIVPYSAIFWVLTLIILAHYLGRKKPMLLIAVSSFIGYIIFSCSKNTTQLFTSQLIQGLTQASYMTTSSMVVLEYTTPRYRGLFLGFFSSTLFWGVWVANTVGIFFNYRYIGLIGVVCTVYTFIAFLFIPESPYWLACQERYDECTAVHRWLKGVGDDSEKELNALIKTQMDLKKKINSSKKRSLRTYIHEYAQIIQDPVIYKPGLLVNLTIIGYNLSGKLACAVYAVEIFKKITKTDTEAYVGVLTLDAFSVAGMYAGSFISNYFKRRTLLIGGSVVCAFFLYCLSFFLFLVKSSILTENFYVAIFLLIGFSLAACIGPIVSANQIFPELYPVKHRTFAMCIICVVSKFVYGSVLKTTPYIFRELQAHGAFLFFGISFSVCIILWYLYIPETKDKTIQEISETFEKKTLESRNEEILIENRTA